MDITPDYKGVLARMNRAVSNSMLYGDSPHQPVTIHDPLGSREINPNLKFPKPPERPRRSQRKDEGEWE